MALYRDVASFCSAVRQVRLEGALNTALEMVVRFVQGIVSRQSTHARIFSSVQLDHLCQELGRPIGERPGSAIEGQTVFLVTALAPSGGHSRVLLDLMKADPGVAHTILLSNVQHESRYDELSETLAQRGGTLHIAPNGDFATRLEWMKASLGRIKPARTYLLQHHYDAVCVAAAQPELTGRLLYYHHCDHALALGMHLAHATHIDFNAKSYYRCREVEGVKDNHYWPLTAPVSASRVGRAFFQRGHLTTCTSGGVEKFENTHLVERIPYLYDYPTVVPIILAATNGTHIHIGRLSDEALHKIETGMEQKGISRHRFVHRPHVANLSDAVVEENVDVYVGSFPSGGGRALVEIMGAGLPVILHANYRSVHFTDVAEAYPGALGWRDVDQLIGHLQGLNYPLLADHSRRAREHYDAHHTPELLQAAIRNTSSEMMHCSAPVRPTYVHDALQTWLDENHSEVQTPEAIAEKAVGTRVLSSILIRRIAARLKLGLKARTQNRLRCL